jgi:hypothetical protein
MSVLTIQMEYPFRCTDDNDEKNNLNLLPLSSRTWPTHRRLSGWDRRARVQRLCRGLGLQLDSLAQKHIVVHGDVCGVVGNKLPETRKLAAPKPKAPRTVIVDLEMPRPPMDSANEKFII